MHSSLTPVTPEEILLRALGEAAGAAIVLDAERRILAFTEAAAALLGQAPELGVSAPKLLCGHGEERPIAEAMAAGRPVAADIYRPDSEGRNHAIRVRATPLRGGDAVTGWLLLLAVDPRRASEGRESDEFGILTRDARMKELLHEVRKVARSEACVLVRGESGTGKELVARAIHLESKKGSGPFRAINCGALSPSLLESELFGHMKGSFTGATRDTLGHFRLADGGTLFLDEVAELPLDTQAKLLRVLQERTVLPVGGTEPVPVDVRIVSATHRALRKEVEAGRFRADLLYRLRVVPLFLPPLRERRDDIVLLAEHFVRIHPSRAEHRLAESAATALSRYDWPGNVRELQNAIEYAMAMSDGALITVADLPPEVRGEDRPPPRNAPTQDEEVPAAARRLLNALERNGGHVGRAAASLGISRTTLWRRMKKLGIRRD